MSLMKFYAKKNQWEKRPGRDEHRPGQMTRVLKAGVLPIMFLINLKKKKKQWEKRPGRDEHRPGQMTRVQK
jgi:hypothetical protein